MVTVAVNLKLITNKYRTDLDCKNYEFYHLFECFIRQVKKIFPSGASFICTTLLFTIIEQESSL